MTTWADSGNHPHGQRGPHFSGTTQGQFDRISSMGQRPPFGQIEQVGQAVVNSTAVIYWHADGGPILHNGSMFFVHTKRALFGVTARHVYEEYLERAETEPTICKINNLKVNLKDRLIGTGTEVDIATFRVTPVELANLVGNIPVPWPPKVPAVGARVFVCGLPGLARSMPTLKKVAFKHSWILMCVDSVSDRGISMVRQPNEEMIDLLGAELPPQNIDIGGMSGGPIAVHMNTPVGSTCWFLSAVITEGHQAQAYDIIHGARADWINDDGTITG